MRIFLSAIEHRSFTKASVAQNISQPAATIIINQIEASFQCEFFERQGATRRAVPTPMGRKVADTFSRILASYDSELARVSNLSVGKRDLRRILIQSSFDSMLSRKWLSEFVGSFTDSDIEIKVLPRKIILEQVCAHEASIGLVDGATEDQKIDYYPMANFEMVLMVPNSSEKYADVGKRISWSELQEGTMLLNDVNPRIMRQIVEIGRTTTAAGVKLTRISGISSMVAMMERTGFPAVVPNIMFAALREFIPGRIIRFKDVSLTSRFGLVTPWGHLTQMPKSVLRSKDCFSDVSDGISDLPVGVSEP